MAKKIISWILVIGVVGFAIFSLTHYKKEHAEPLPEVESTAVFMSEDGKTVPAIFYDGVVMFNIEGLGDTVLAQTISGSGARYANEDESIVFWNKGDSVTITKDGVDIFVGTVYDKSSPGENGEGSSSSNTTFLLSDSSWSWVSTGMSNSTTITPNKKDVFTVTFNEDGTLSGTTDCNNFGGTYTTGENNSITFGEFSSTQMYCEGSQEGAFIDMIGKADHFMFTNDGNLVLLLKYDSGSIMFRKK